MLPDLVAKPSSFHIPVFSSMLHKGMVVGALASKADGIAVVRVAFDPDLICSFSPLVDSRSTATIPNDSRITRLLLLSFAMNDPGTVVAMSEAVGSMYDVYTLTVPVKAAPEAATTIL